MTAVLHDLRSPHTAPINFYPMWLGIIIKTAAAVALTALPVSLGCSVVLEWTSSVHLGTCGLFSGTTEDQSACTGQTGSATELIPTGTALR